jgi:DNA invertase Pin-like site-specific DNA recombinase
MPATALYCRVSTTDQSLDRQQQLTWDYATDQLAVEPTEITVFTDKSTGTDTERAGYRDLMGAVTNGEVERVIASEVSRISRSVRDFSATVERVVDDNETGLHILDMNLALDPDERDPYTRAFLQVAATFAELEAEIKRQNIRDGIAARKDMDKWHGRPPFGFEIGPEGYLAPDGEYDTAVAILDALDNGESKRALARTTGVPRSTIQEIEKKRDLYA